MKAAAWDGRMRCDVADVRLWPAMEPMSIELQLFHPCHTEANPCIYSRMLDKGAAFALAKKLIAGGSDVLTANAVAGLLSMGEVQS